MIAKLYGVLDSILDNGAIINVGGVGYFIFASSRTLMELGAIGDPVVVHIDTHAVSYTHLTLPTSDLV